MTGHSKSQQPPAEPQAPKSGWLCKGDMAASLGISVQAFDKWGVSAEAKIGRQVFYTARAVVDNRISHTIQKHQPDDPSDMDQDQLEYQRWRLTKEQADKIERENQIAAKTVVPTEFALFALQKIAPQIASILDTIPLTMRRRYPELQTKHIEAVQRLIVEASNQAAALGDTLPGLLDEYLNRSD